MSIPLVGVPTEKYLASCSMDQNPYYMGCKAEKDSKPWKDIPISSIPLVGVLMENIWQGGSLDRTVGYGNYTKIKNILY